MNQNYDKTLNMLNMQISNNVCVFESVLTEETCTKLINNLTQEAEWEKAVTTGELLGKQTPQSSPRQSDNFFISACDALKDTDAFIHHVFVNCLERYLSMLGHKSAADAGITEDEGYIALRYPTGGYYKEHIDYSSNSDPKLQRVVSGLIYLNDDYIGGEIAFPLQGLSIKPKKGTVVLFPSIFTHPHKSKTIKAGTKYSIVTWWQ